MNMIMILSSTITTPSTKKTPPSTNTTKKQGEQMTIKKLRTISPPTTKGRLEPVTRTNEATGIAPPNPDLWLAVDNEIGVEASLKRHTSENVGDVAEWETKEGDERWMEKKKSIKSSLG